MRDRKEETSMFSDTHLHTDFSGDCATPAARQVEQAIAMGMKEICITDHHDYDIVSDLDFNLDLNTYFPYMKQLQAQYRDRIGILIGIELGLQMHIKDYLDDLVQNYSFDFIIGSSHIVDGRDPYCPASYFKGRSQREGYERYFESTLNRVKGMDCFDSFGHLDYVVRYGPTKNRDYSLKTYGDYIDPILKALIERGKGLECNTGGYKHGLGQPNPSEEILTRYRELGGELLTVGSDAHLPEYIGYEFDRIRDLFLRCGFRYYTVYHDRKPVFYRI